MINVKFWNRSFPSLIFLPSKLPFTSNGKAVKVFENFVGSCIYKYEHQILEMWETAVEFSFTIAGEDIFVITES